MLAGPPGLRAFLRARENDGDVDFMLTEAVIIAEK
jgi:hypothetical protein